jgi:hypothetical protein
MQIASRHFPLAAQGGCVARDVTRKCFHTYNSPANEVAESDQESLLFKGAPTAGSFRGCDYFFNGTGT